ncbi:MAG: hypothetical protein K2O10_00685, partial [Muribaculaceae bacterium]|nr:hypothetical protein [Muribaculaceae bacterium]
MNISKTLAKCVAVLGVGVAAFVPSQARETTASTLERGIEPREISLNPLAGDGAVRTGVKPVRAPLSAALPTGSEPAAVVKQLPARAAQNRPALYGSVVSANSWTPGNKASKTGIYRIPVSQGEAFEAVSVGADAPNASNGGAMVGDTYYAANIYDGFLTYYYMSSYNPETWERIRRSNTGSKGCMAYDLACDPVTGKTYGCFLKEYGTGYVFGSYNFATNAVSLVRNVANPYVALAFDADGQLYGIAAQVDDVSGAVTGSTLYAIDKASGAPTVVGHNACKPYYNTSAVIDPSSNRMYWTVSEADASSALYEVNLISGAAVKVCDFADGEQVCGLYIDTPPAAAGAPAAPVDVTASFPG